MAINRYDIYATGADAWTEEELCDDGEWIKFEDFEKELKEIVELVRKQEIDRFIYDAVGHPLISQAFTPIYDSIVRRYFYLGVVKYKKQEDEKHGK